MEGWPGDRSRTLTGYRRRPAAEPGLAMMVLRARKVAGKPTVAIPQTAGGLSGARFRRTEHPSRYRLLDREVEAGHHPNDGRRRHQFPASNGLSRCSGQSRALNGNPQASLGSATVPYTRLSRFSRFASPPNFINSAPGFFPGPNSTIRPTRAAEYDSQHPPPCPKSRPEAAYFHNDLFHRKKKGPASPPGLKTSGKGLETLPLRAFTSPRRYGSRCRRRGSGHRGRPDERTGWTRPGS